MPMDGVMLGFVAHSLHQALAGARVDKVAQPERDEINIYVRSLGENQILLITGNANSARAQLTQVRKSNPLEPSSFCMLLRKHIVPSRLTCVRQIDGDRILEFDFESADELGDRTVKTLVCEFMGRHSNVILVRGGRIIDSMFHVNEQISRVREVLPGLAYERPPKQDKIGYDRLSPAALGALLPAAGPAAKALQEAIAGLSKQTARELALRAAGDPDARVEEMGRDELAARACASMAAFLDEAAPTLVLGEDNVPVDVTPIPYRIYMGLASKRTEGLSQAIEAFYRTRDQMQRMAQKSASIARLLRNNIERCEKKLGLQMQALADGERMEEYRLKGELLMSNLHLARKGMRRVAVPNYYDPDCTEMEIELDEKRSPGENAQRYFKRYQKAKSARALAAEQRVRTQEELAYLEGQMANLANCREEAELSEIREELEHLGYARRIESRKQLKKLPPSQPLRFESSDGRTILVGKNNLQNDKLLESARPEEYWLHAKDMPGSHVIIVGEAPSEIALAEASSLAAYYSKGREAGRVPVDHTMRKYVKKPNGAKPGFVIYTHQKTVFAQPRETVGK